jgi:very-short-patch-repair endonuclease/predicted transcriptional regulator of viral defense system
MAPRTLQSPSAEAWSLAQRQHYAIARRQLLSLGLTVDAIRHRVATGRLHPSRWMGVYAVGRPQLSRHGQWMAALLACGPDAVLSHGSAAALWGIVALEPGAVHVSVPKGVVRRRAGIKVHRRSDLRPHMVTAHQGVPVTGIVWTLIDLATGLGSKQLERAVNEADRLDLIDPEALRAAVDAAGARPGIRPLRRLLDRLTFVLTESELERLFLPVARRAGLRLPQTGAIVNGFKVDFFWPELGLVVETDGLRYHRTPAQQARDRLRDQTHLAAGLTPLRFTHAQVKFERERVAATLTKVAGRLGS